MTSPYGGPVTPPQNAPPTVSPPVGVQPGVTPGIVRASVVIISGGGTTGLFVYSGPPSLGNPPVLWAVPPGTTKDLFGNTLPGGANIFGIGTPNGQGLSADDLGNLLLSSSVSGSNIALKPNVNQAMSLTAALSGILEAAEYYSTPDSHQSQQAIMSSVVLGTGSSAKMATLITSPYGSGGNGMGILLQAVNDGGTDLPWMTIGSVSTQGGVITFTPQAAYTKGAYIEYTGVGTINVVTFTSSTTWVAPAGVTTASVQCWGGGGGGGGAGSGATAGGAGGNTSFSGPSATTVTAHGGGGGGGATSGDGTAGAAGTGSTNSVKFAGGAGAPGEPTNTVGQDVNDGGGGGGSAGTSSAGTSPTSTTDAASGAPAVSGGGPGGDGFEGGISGVNGTGSAPLSGPGGGGGGGVAFTGPGIFVGAGGGGGGGEYAQEASDTVVPTDSYTVTIGAAGSAGAGTAGSAAGGAGFAGQVTITYFAGTPSIGWTANFTGSSITDQFGTSVGTGIILGTLATLSGSGSLGGNVVLASGSGLKLQNGAENVTLTSGTNMFSNELDVNGGIYLNNSGGAYLAIKGGASFSTYGGSGSFYANSNGVPGGSTGNGILQGTLNISQTDLTNTTVTGTGDTQLGTAWSMPANDAVAGTVYRATYWGTFTLGATADQQNWSYTVAGTNRELVFGFSTIHVSGTYGWRVQIEVLIQTAGSGGTAMVNANLQFGWVGTGSNGSAQWQTGVAGTTFNTTTANTLFPTFHWSATTNSPSLTTYGSLFERLGP